MTWSLWVISTHIDNIEQPYNLIAKTVAAVFYVLSIFTYFRVIYVGPGSPGDYPELRLPPQEARSSHNSPYDRDTTHSAAGESPKLAIPPTEIYASHTFKDNELTYKLCHVCDAWKPDRCHHCNNCKKCVLKMDHHCPWFACCIGHKNHKYFIQTLMYMVSFAGWLLMLSSYELYRFFVDQDFDLHTYLSLNLVFVLVLSFTFFVSLGVFTGFSIYLLLKNYTTIEFQDSRWNYNGNYDAQYEFDSSGKRKKLGHIWDLGVKQNLADVMGDTWLSWLLPIKVTSDSLSAGHRDGVHFEVNEETYEKVVTNARLQAQLNSQLAEYRERARQRHETYG